MKPDNLFVPYMRVRQLSLTGNTFIIFHAPGLMRKRYWGRHLWARGYFCATVDNVTEKMIAAYIANQEKASPEDAFKIADE
jgi:REP element-mobilizing transposase RayT